MTALASLRDPLAKLFASKTAERVVLFLVIVLCAIGNLPWHLDNYDQAKQAFVSYEIAHGGSAFYGHTPAGDAASKPPLAAWLSLPIYWATGSWDLAWRLPGFLCTLVLLVFLMREARRILPEGGALLVAAAFGLNLLTPRIATLVRTDMLLTAGITACGWLIYRKVTRGEPWSLREKLLFFAFMLATMFTKGPIIYAFLLPGMVAFAFLGPKGRRHLVWSGWWTWVVPLALFALWLGIGIATRKEFYHDIVVTEFFSRFDQSLKPDERQQPIWFYLPHLLHKFAPWSLLLLALPILSQNVRRALRQRPDLLWLACWAVGGLLCMTFVPSKRVDRIFPVIPPFCLLLVNMVAACQCGPKVRAWCAAAIIGAICMTGGYFVTIVIQGYHDQNDRLARFGREVQKRTATRQPLAVVKAKDEGLLMYALGDTSLHRDRAVREFHEGRRPSLLIPARLIEPGDNLPAPALDSGPIPPGRDQRETRYLLFIRDN